MATEKLSVRGLINRLGDERGKASEAMVEDVFRRRLEAGKVPVWLIGYQRADQKDNDRGIDGWFVTDVGKIPLQLKSSRKAMYNALEKRPRIPVVVIKVGQSEDAIYSTCMAVLELQRNKYLELRKPQPS